MKYLIWPLCLCLIQTVNADWNETLDAVENVYRKLGSNLDLSAEQLRSQAHFPPRFSRSTEHAHPLAYYVFPAKVPSEKTLLWLGGVHPDEYMASYISWRFLLDLIDDPRLLPETYHVIYVPMVNPDGQLHFPKKRNYPTRTTSAGIDLNRSFYDRTRFPVTIAPNEVNFVLDLVEQYQPQYIIAPHSSLFILDLDGPKTPQHKWWVEQISRLSEHRGAKKIPVIDFRTYGQAERGRDWSLGKWVEVMSQRGLTIASLTFEFGGPGEHPGPNDPDRALKISRRKHLGRYQNNTHLAEEAYQDYFPALITGLMSEVFTPLQSKEIN